MSPATEFRPAPPSDHHQKCEQDEGNYHAHELAVTEMGRHGAKHDDGESRRAWLRQWRNSNITAPPISPTPTRTTNHGGYPQAANLPAHPPRPSILGSPIATKKSANSTLIAHKAMDTTLPCDRAAGSVVATATSLE
jgi:hypothetical protein